MSSAKKTQASYEALLKDYERAQAQFTRTQLSEKAAKKNLKKAIKGDASKSEVEVLRLELEIAKSKRKARKAGAAIAKTLMKHWIKTNAKGKKSYKLTIREEVPVPTPMEVIETSEEVRTKRPYTRRPKTETAAGNEVMSQTAPAEEAKTGKFAVVEEAPKAKKERAPRKSRAEAAAEREAAQAALRERGDDFSIIEGIGSTMTDFLHSTGVTTFAALAASDMDALKEQLVARRNFISDPSTWAQQAQMVVDNNWEGLKEIQDSLKKPRS